MRKIITINDDWMFAGQAGDWEKVQIPHTWNAIDGQDGGNDYYRGEGKYQKKFSYLEYDKNDEEVFLEFNGVNASAIVKLNHKKMCSHHGGYSAFRVNITEYLKEENILEVLVNNSVNKNVYPQKADFTFYGGIYRDVKIIITKKDHFEMEYHGTPGIKVFSERIDNDAQVQVEAYTKCKTPTIRYQITDINGKLVTEKVGGLKESLKLENVHLWQGIQDPYLYSISAQLIVEGNVRDEVSLRFGVRTIYFDPEKGFFLNGKSFPLRGVSRHQDFKAIGYAISDEQKKSDMEMIKEIGANCIRLAHYQHDQFFYDLCDEYGLLVWAEIPYISEHMPSARENTISQMKELISQNYHHVSIITWGISNEITISTKNKKDMLDNHHELNRLCHQMDKTRPTTLACYALCNPFSRVVHITDIVGYNLYLGWYVPGFFLNDWFMNLFHKFYPERPLGYSEYGAEGMPNIHSERPRRGDHSEEYQAIYHEYMLKCINRHPFLWGTFVWNLFDFAADARNQGGEPGMNHKGLVTFDRKIKKDSFYLYKAYWSREPMVHICSKRFKERTKDKVKIKVYSNQSEVSLYHNGKLVEKKYGDKVFEFLISAEKTNHIEAVANNMRDEMEFTKVQKLDSHYKLQGKSSNSANWV